LAQGSSYRKEALPLTLVAFSASLCAMFWIYFGAFVLTVAVLRGLWTLGPSRRPRVTGGTGAKLQSALKSVPLLWSCPRGPLDFCSALQLLAFAMQMCWEELRCYLKYEFERDELDVKLPGDSTDGCPGRVAVNWLLGYKGTLSRDLPPDAPIVLLCPGLNCYTASLPGTSIYASLLERPWRVGVFEKRGVGPPGKDGESSKLSTPAFHLFGHPSDLHEAVLHIESKYPNAPLHIVGMSSGNGLTGSYACLHGKEAKQLRSVLLMIGGEDYNCAFQAPNATWFSGVVFDWVLLASTKSRFLKRNEATLRAKDNHAYEAAMQATTLQACYDVCMRNFSGYNDPDEGERRINPFSGGCEALRGLEVPFLYVSTLDDPVAPGGPRPEWCDVLKDCENAALALFPCGSHLGCYDSWRFTRWSDKLVVQWVEAFEKSS